MNLEFKRETLRKLEKATEALKDCVSGLRYIRESYGELYGVGFDRALGKADSSIASLDELVTTLTTIVADKVQP